MANPVERNFQTGQLLFQEGEHPRSLFLIRKGTVGIRKSKGHDQIELGRLHSNEVLGELSFFDRHPRSATAVALTSVQALELSFESLDQIYDQVPDYLKTIMASVAARLRKANEEIRRLQTETVSENIQASSGELTASDVLAAVDAASDIPLGSLDLSKEDPSTDESGGV